MAVRTKDILPTDPIGRQVLRMPIGATATSQTALEVDEITPGFNFRVVDTLITNFHLPKSTLMMLVSALAGYEQVMALYRHAIEARYRFFSYGDAMILNRACDQ